MESITAAVVLYNNAGLIPALSETLSALLPAATVIYDSGSTDRSAELAAQLLPEAVVLKGENLGFGHGCNMCLERIDSRYTLLLNSDASISPEDLELLAAALDEDPELAAVQPVIRLWGWEMVTAGRGVYVTPAGESWDAGFMHLEPAVQPGVVETPAVTAAVALWRTSVLKQLGGFDTGYFMYFEDADLSLRARAAGWKTGLCCDSSAIHMVGASSSREEAGLWELRSSLRLYRRFLSSTGRAGALRWYRQLRSAAGLLRRGRSPLKRLAAFFRGALERTPERFLLDENTMGMLHGTPGDMPLKRPEPGAPGPGWTGGRAAPWAGVSTSGKDIHITLTGGEHACTGALLAGDGKTLRRFTVPSGERIEIALADPPGIVYIKCDSFSDSVSAEVR